MRRACFLFLLLTVELQGAYPAQAQNPGENPGDLQREVQESQLRLERIREERAQLQREMDELRSRVQNAAGELQNIERQLGASRSVLGEIDFQLETANFQASRATGDLLRIRDELRARQDVLNRRLRDIYKRGPLHTTRVLLGAESFADLLNRYHYLEIIARYDRALVNNVRTLELELTRQNLELQQTLAELSRLREAQLGEVAVLRRVEDLHLQALEQFGTQERQTISRLNLLDEDESRLAGLVTDLDRRRVEEASRRALAGIGNGDGNLSATDVGELDWPVDGPIVYPFGLERRRDGTTLRWNGVGIQAPVGTPVRAVRGGTVSMAGPFEGYGPSVILSHGAGFYTLYLYLEEIGVPEGVTVEAGQVIGTVGGDATPEGPRVEFQLRAPTGQGIPQAIDPMTWLRPRGGGS